MGKKKNKGKHGHKHGDGAAEVRFEVPPAMAGIAAMVAKQVATPAARQMIAGALTAAADAIAGRDGAGKGAAERGGSGASGVVWPGAQPARAAGTPHEAPVEPPFAPVPPVPPIPPEPPRAASGDGAARGGGEVPPIQIPPEAARVIGAAASALERWAQGLGKPRV